METTATTTKVCTLCGRELPIDEFGIKTKSSDGHNSWCKECTRKKAKMYNDRKRAEKKNEAMFANTTKPTEGPLSAFTPRQLMEELKARGYRGTLTFTNTISFDKL